MYDDYKLDDSAEIMHTRNDPHNHEYIDILTQKSPITSWENIITQLSMYTVEKEDGTLDIMTDKIDDINKLLKSSLYFINNPHISENDISNEIYLHILVTLLQNQDTPDQIIQILVDIAERIFIHEFNDKLYSLAIEIAKICVSRTGNIQYVALSALYNLMSDKRKDNIEYRLDIHKHITHDLLRILLTQSNINLINGILLYIQALLYLFSKHTIDYHHEFEQEFVPLIGSEVISLLIPYNEVITPTALNVISYLSCYPIGCDFLLSRNIYHQLFQLYSVHKEILTNNEAIDDCLSLPTFELFFRFANFENYKKIEITVFKHPEFPDIIRYELDKSNNETKDVILKMIYIFIEDYGEYFETTGIINEIVIMLLQGAQFNERVLIVNILLIHFMKAPKEIIQKYMTSDIILGMIDVVTNMEDNMKIMNNFCEVMLNLIPIFPHLFDILDNEDFYDSLDEFIDNNSDTDHAAKLLNMLESSKDNQ